MRLAVPMIFERPLELKNTHVAYVLHTCYTSVHPIIMFYNASKKRRPDHPGPRTGYSGIPSSVVRTPTLCKSAAPLDENKLHTRMRKPRELIKPRCTELIHTECTIKRHCKATWNSTAECYARCSNHSGPMRVGAASPKSSKRLCHHPAVRTQRSGVRSGVSPRAPLHNIQARLP